MKTTSTSENAATAAGKTTVQASVLHTKDTLLKKIIAYLRLHHHLDAAFLISKQTHSKETRCYFPPRETSLKREYTYTLFLITAKPLYTGNGTNPAQLMDALYNHTQNRAKVYLIAYSATEFEAKITCGNNFLKHILNYSRCVYTVTDKWLHFKSNKINRHEQIVDKITRHWETRIERANYLMEITGCVGTYDNPIAHFEVLQNVLRQSCLGLIYLFWEYKPSYAALPYLLHLCSHFGDFPKQLFHNNTYENHLLYHHLIKADQYMKFKVNTPLSLEQANKAWKKCQTFLMESQNIADQQLLLLEKERERYMDRLFNRKNQQSI
ncbi:hypothetical protein [Planktosalinus lacus]|uniref:Uncharacterized protein n=1 Tax=Planktosalinus lacus TaxID=1526573 RepID=A0A8J2Y8S0_9FLAO|nr:hypothetical protein [Planktosalinus lacus]GGD84916.1 hypothetical protein GCM10011312_06190 [Planktosalinus lacus]